MSARCVSCFLRQTPRRLLGRVQSYGLCGPYGFIDGEKSRTRRCRRRNKQDRDSLLSLLHRLRCYVCWNGHTLSSLPRIIWSAAGLRLFAVAVPVDRPLSDPKRQHRCLSRFRNPPRPEATQGRTLGCGRRAASKPRSIHWRSQECLPRQYGSSSVCSKAGVSLCRPRARRLSRILRLNEWYSFRRRLPWLIQRW